MEGLPQHLDIEKLKQALSILFKTHILNHPKHLSIKKTILQLLVVAALIEAIKKGNDKFQPNIEQRLQIWWWQKHINKGIQTIIEKTSLALQAELGEWENFAMGYKKDIKNFFTAIAEEKIKGLKHLPNYRRYNSFTRVSPSIYELVKKYPWASSDIVNNNVFNMGNFSKEIEKVVNDVLFGFEDKQLEKIVDFITLCEDKIAGYENPEEKVEKENTELDKYPKKRQISNIAGDEKLLNQTNIGLSFDSLQTIKVKDKTFSKYKFEYDCHVMGVGKKQLLTDSLSGAQFIRHAVDADGDCGYTAFGITRNEAYQLLSDNLAANTGMLSTVVAEQLIQPGFVDYLVQQGIGGTGLGTAYQHYTETTGPENTQALANLQRFAEDLAVQQGYLNYDVRDLRVDAGWAHPAVLQLLAHIQGAELNIWRRGDDGQLLPHAQYPHYRPAAASQRTDLLFVNANHFERLEQVGPTATYQNRAKNEGIHETVKKPEDKLLFFHTLTCNFFKWNTINIESNNQFFEDTQTASNKKTI